MVFITTDEMLARIANQAWIPPADVKLEYGWLEIDQSRTLTRFVWRLRQNEGLVRLVVALSICGMDNTALTREIGRLHSLTTLREVSVHWGNDLHNSIGQAEVENLVNLSGCVQLTKLHLRIGFLPNHQVIHPFTHPLGNLRVLQNLKTLIIFLPCCGTGDDGAISISRLSEIPSLTEAKLNFDKNGLTDLCCAPLAAFTRHRNLRYFFLNLINNNIDGTNLIWFQELPSQNSRVEILLPETRSILDNIQGHGHGNIFVPRRAVEGPPENGFYPH